MTDAPWLCWAFATSLLHAQVDSALRLCAQHQLQHAMSQRHIMNMNTSPSLCVVCMMKIKSTLAVVCTPNPAITYMLWAAPIVTALDKPTTHRFANRATRTQSAKAISCRLPILMPML
ncbi:unnamed protein product [Cyclocybe aegerita]|uniref:Secreted protein n=1 Tax=Cyclocybe aegerita TaxID=1973307 RepID=A0A8S0WN95_CYCAE|nr:unnamed protein product [Cyclocybe aegerita]